MKTMKSLYFMIGSLAALLLGTSCEHKELCYLHPHTAQLQVEFDWSYAPYAEQNNLAEGMCLWFYPVDEGGRADGRAAALRFVGDERRND